MSWTDHKSIEHIKTLRDLFDIRTFVETGTHVGINSELHSKNFKHVITCEINDKYILEAKRRLKHIDNVEIVKQSSPKFLKRFTSTNRTEFFYLDAHFYDPTLPMGKRFVVLDELKSLAPNRNCVIAIHDFDNGLGHITYDGISLDFKLLRDRLLKINPKFRFYTNELSSCKIMYVSEATDEFMYNNLKYAWSKPEKAYRGILYCTPEHVKIDGLKEITSW